MPGMSPMVPPTGIFSSLQGAFQPKVLHDTNINNTRELLKPFFRRCWGGAGGFSELVNSVSYGYKRLIIYKYKIIMRPKNSQKRQNQADHKRAHYSHIAVETMQCARLWRKCITARTFKNQPIVQYRILRNRTRAPPSVAVVNYILTHLTFFLWYIPHTHVFHISAFCRPLTSWTWFPEPDRFPVHSFRKSRGWADVLNTTFWTRFLNKRLFVCFIKHVPLFFLQMLDSAGPTPKVIITRDNLIISYYYN